MNNNNVSVAKINEGIVKLQDEFMAPLERVGQQLLDDYKSLNMSLQSDVINNLIREQESKLNSLKAELSSICAKARSGMEDSNRAIQQSSSEINDTLGSL